MYFEDLLFHVCDTERSVINGQDGYDIGTADLVVALNWYPGGARSFRDIAYTVALYLQERAVPLWNSEAQQQRSSTKLSALWLLAREHVAIPDTFFSLNHDVLQAAVPFEESIVKDIAASRGKHNYLVHSVGERADLLSRQPHMRFLVQEVIPNDYDIRLVCIGGTPRLVLKRQRVSNQTHLNNTSQGAVGTLLPLQSLPEQVLRESIMICRIFGRELAGIDYVVANDGTGRYICLEVNAVPQLTSGTYLAEKGQAISAAIAELLERN
jgi:glutathione synthase/RimK-type ligase-like ATP-grasp enzyme